MKKMLIVCFALCCSQGVLAARGGSWKYSSGSWSDSFLSSIELPDTITVEADSADGAVVSFDVSGTDRRGNEVDVNCSPASGSLFSLGETVVSCYTEGRRWSRVSGDFSVIVMQQYVEAVSPEVITEVYEEVITETDTVVIEEPVVDESVVVVDEPVVDEPVVVDDEPVVEEPVVVVDEPIVDEPVVVADEPAVDESVVVVDEPVVDEPVVVVDEPVVDEPIVDEPVVVDDEPVVDESVVVIDEPVVDEPVVVDDEPAVDEPVVVVDEPLVDESVVVDDEPVVDESVVVDDEPVVDESVVVIDDPVVDEPVVVVDEPVVDEPVVVVDTQVATSLSSVTVNWIAPSAREDGSPLLPGEISSYEIYVIGEFTGIDQMIRIDDPAIYQHVLSDLSDDTYYFSISAIDINGVYSQPSDLIAVTLGGG